MSAMIISIHSLFHNDGQVQAIIQCNFAGVVGSGPPDCPSCTYWIQSFCYSLIEQAISNDSSCSWTWNGEQIHNRNFGFCFSSYCLMSQLINNNEELLFPLQPTNGPGIEYYLAIFTIQSRVLKLLCHFPPSGSFNQSTGLPFYPQVSIDPNFQFFLAEQISFDNSVLQYYSLPDMQLLYDLDTIPSKQFATYFFINENSNGFILEATPQLTISLIDWLKWDISLPLNFSSFKVPTDMNIHHVDWRFRNNGTTILFDSNFPVVGVVTIQLGCFIEQQGFTVSFYEASNLSILAYSMRNSRIVALVQSGKTELIYWN
jgi:hypothetical protein